MTSTDHILDQIDTALDDWSVSDDAMRSRPAAQAPSWRGATPTLQIMDEAGEWQEVQGVLSACFDMEIDPATIDISAISAQATATWEDVRQSIIRVQEEQARRAQEVLATLKRALTQLTAPAAQAVEELRHLPEADDCDACGPPPPRDRPAWQSPYGPARRRR